MQCTLDIGVVHPLAFPTQDKKHLRKPYPATEENFPLNDALTRMFIFGKMPLQDVGKDECMGITFPLPLKGGEGSLFKHNVHAVRQLSQQSQYQRFHHHFMAQNFVTSNLLTADQRKELFAQKYFVSQNIINMQSPLISNVTVGEGETRIPAIVMTKRLTEVSLDEKIVLTMFSYYAHAYMTTLLAHVNQRSMRQFSPNFNVASSLIDVNFGWNPRKTFERDEELMHKMANHEQMLINAVTRSVKNFAGSRYPGVAGIPLEL